MTAIRAGHRLGRTLIGLALLLSLTVFVGPAASESGVANDRDRQIAELERQIAELKQKIAGLKTPAEKKVLTPDDVDLWNAISAAELSDDGQWFACAVRNESETVVVVRQTKGDKEHRFSAGKGASPSPEFSADSRWVLFAASMGKGKGSKTVLVDLKSGDKQEFEDVRRAVFSGESATWLALHRSPASEAPKTPGKDTPTPPSNAPAAEKAGGNDLILRELATGTELVLGNVAEFGFDKKGTRLALLVSAAGQVGNGVQMRDMTTGVLTSLDTARAAYQRLSWTDDGSAFAVLKSVEDKAYETKLTSFVAFTDLDAKSPRKIVYDPAKDASFPKGWTLSTSRPATWREDRSAIVFGIQELKKKTEEKKEAPKEKEKEKEKEAGKSGTKKSDKPDLVLWHWQDERLQSQQQVQAGNDRTQSFAAVYHVADGKFVRLADEQLKDVTIPSRGDFAVGFDRKAYQLQSTLDGKRFQDVYAIDLKTGQRKRLLEKNRWMSSVAPDGKHLLYYDDGHFRVCELATGKTTALTKDVPTSFIDSEDDHNVDRPPTMSLGWTRDSSAVLLSDDWDLWLVPLTGGKGTNLTVNGKAESLRYRMRYRLDPEEKGIDFSQPQYFAVQAEWTKQAGVVRIDGGKPGGTRLLWGDASFGGLSKARKADVFVYTRETCHDFPDYYATGADFKEPRRLTQVNPIQDKYAWCAGTQLVEYKGVRGERLQGLLLLPAGYEKGKSYPTVVYIYEKLTGGRYRYLAPRVGGFNAALYTSAGYAVLMPDISYKINDPGVSSAQCVLAALAAAEKTGVVDPARVGLHGHSWGGYQTAFIITQTNAFKCAVAGAPLTNLVSMYSSIYWNTGSANQPIFESSQGRFTSGYWDNQEAYLRNSPVFHAKAVQTPLMLLHNDKDGAVDWNQGIEYFNTLRRLQKPVVLLQYKGENHGLVKEANRRDYTERMREFFDHYLLGKPAPAWLKEGVPHLKLDAHLKERLER